MGVLPSGSNVFRGMGTSIQYPGMLVSGIKICPFKECNSSNIMYPAIALASSHYLDQSAPDTPTGSGNPTAKLGFLGQYSASGFPTYSSWFCMQCGRAFSIPSFMPDYMVLNAVGSGTVIPQF